MRLLDLNAQPGRVLIGPMGLGNNSPTYTYSWLHAEVDAFFNDAQESHTNTLTTTNPADPITYLTYDPAYVQNVTTTSLGGGQWRVDFDTVVNSGSPGPVSSPITAHTASFNLVMPGYVVYYFVVNGKFAIDQYSLNGVTFFPATLLIGYQSDSAPDLYLLAEIGAGSGGATTNISGFAVCSDARMDVSTLAPVVTSGNGTVGGSLGPIDPFSHLSAFLMEMTENTPGGTTVLADWPATSGFPIQFPNFHWIFPD